MNLETHYYKNSTLTKIPVGIKLAVLFCIGTLLFVYPSWKFSLLLGFSVLAVYQLGTIPLKEAFQPLFHAKYILAMIFFLHVFNNGWIRGVEITSSFMIIGSLSRLINATTKVSELLKGLESFFQQFQWLGIDPKKISLAVSMAIRFIPLVGRTIEEVRVAQKAKGMDKNVVAVIVPTVVRTLKMSDEIADAIDARG